jgi:hypothetical protein
MSPTTPDEQGSPSDPLVRPFTSASRATIPVVLSVRSNERVPVDQPSWLRGEYHAPTDWMPVGWGVGRS